jgi:hypothetical protein
MGLAAASGADESFHSSSTSNSNCSGSSSGGDAAADGGDGASSSNELSTEELKRVSQGCLEFLRRSVTDSQSSPPDLSQSAPTSTDDHVFVQYLVTATLCLGLAPRSQVLAQLRLGRTFERRVDGCYWVQMPAELNKNGRPTLFALPAQLTPAFDFYLNHIRPRLMRPIGAAPSHDFVFMRRSGKAPRTNFSDLTSLVTERLLGRPVNAHAFRSAVITAFYQSGATQSDMDVLAMLMAHDASTARNHYFRPQLAQAAVGATQRMVDVLGAEPHASHSGAVHGASAQAPPTTHDHPEERASAALQPSADLDRPGLGTL